VSIAHSSPLSHSSHSVLSRPILPRPDIDPQGIFRLRFPPMAKKASTYPPAKAGRAGVLKDEALPAGRASALLDTRVVYCGDRLEQLPNLTDRCVGLICIDPPIAG
jgi:hypothetical protein